MINLWAYSGWTARRDLEIQPRQTCASASGFEYVTEGEEARVKGEGVKGTKVHGHMGPLLSFSMSGA